MPPSLAGAPPLPASPAAAARPLLAEFLEWVLGEGQRYVGEMGYIAVGPDRIAAALAAVRGDREKE